MKLLAVFLVLLGLLEICVANVYYVKPENGSYSLCPHQPCLPLDHYINNTVEYFTSDSTFVFLPGQHTMVTSISLNLVSNITLKGMGPNANATIVIHYPILFCRNLSMLNVTWLTFDTKGVRFSVRMYSAAAIRIDECMDVIISDCKFQGDGKLLVLGIKLSYNISVVNSLFEGNAGIFGGAISVLDSYLILSNTTFAKNVAHLGGAVYCNSITLLISSTHFLHNSAISNSWGGAIFMFSSHLIVSDNVTFSCNTASFGGGIFLQYNSTVTIDGKAVLFSTNVADYGGGIYMKEQSHIKGSSSAVQFISNRAEKFGGGIMIA